MFYSATFLARKGPLGTVWCAAHLEHRLKKSQYVSTNIPSTVGRIIYPEVHIALRMSAHLLLGVVRIYSKQVDYLYEDCNGVLRTMNRVFTAVAVNLPEDANHAPYHSITLPQRFELDALDLDDHINDWGVDTHLGNQEDITLTEQIPIGKDPYIVVTLDEHALRSSSVIEDDDSGLGPMPMDEDLPSRLQEQVATGFEDLGSSNQFDNVGLNSPSDDVVRDSGPQRIPSVEIQRDARHDLDKDIASLILPDRAEPDKLLEEQINNDLDKEIASSVAKGTVFHQENNSFGHKNSPIIFPHRSPEIELQASPPPIAQPNIRKRKTKHLAFDAITVLSNNHMKKSIDDTRGLLRVRKNPTSLDIWKVNKRLRKEDAFFEPFLTGTCVELQDIHKEDFISSRPNLIIIEDVHHEIPPIHEEDDIEIEVLCINNNNNNEHAFDDLRSSNGKSDFTPQNSNSGLDYKRIETTEGGESHSNTGHFDSEMEKTPSTFHRDGMSFERTGLSDIPELVPSAEVGFSMQDLGFLELDDNTSSGSQATPQFVFGSMIKETPGFEALLSSRTRAVAQYLKKHSPVSTIAENSGQQMSDLHLNKILKGKSRKVCARMFYETLVLKTLDLIDVHQEKPYDDVMLKVTI